MVKIIKPDPLSFSSLYLETLFSGNQLGIATGFIWKHEDSNYVVTNWHVVSGINPYTGQPINKYDILPDSLRVWLYLAEDMGKWAPYDIPLLDSQDRPLWKEHNSYRDTVDVALLSFNPPENFKL